VLFLRLAPWQERGSCGAQETRQWNLEGEPQVSPGVASLPVASGVREHIVGIANRFQTQAFMQRYTCLPRHTIVGDCARLGLFCRRASPLN
jgi:hypothetical protein